MLTIGLAGTAKNTGKTTTTQALVAEANARRLRLALTSIGYDGETWDNVTRLPKPRITVQLGTLVATAERCLIAGTARLERITATAALTPLGRVFLAQASAPGTVVLAGPHTAEDLKPVLDHVAERGADLALVDGAINRIMPMRATDGLILATGAARTPDIPRLADETRAIAQLFTLPSHPGTAGECTHDTHRGPKRQEKGHCEPPASNRQGSLDSPPEVITLSIAGQVVATFSSGSLLTASAARALATTLRRRVPAGLSPAAHDSSLVIPGQASAAALETLADALPGVSLVLTDPLKLLLAGDPPRVREALASIEARGGTVSVLRPVPLLAITVNPFYPRFRYERDDYEPAYVDAEALWSAIRDAVDVPVVDVVRHGAATLLQWAMRP